VKLCSLALIVRPERPSAIRTLGPLKTKPVQIIEHGLNEGGFAAGDVQIFISKDQRALVLTGAFLRGPERPRVAEMQQSRW
jgi:hypothetical protein